MYERNQQALVSHLEPAELAVALPFDMGSLAESIRSSASMIENLQDTSEADLAAERERMRQISAATHRTIERGLSLQTEQKDTYLLLQSEIDAYDTLHQVQAEAVAAQASKTAQLAEKRVAQHDQAVEARRIDQQKQAAAAEAARIDRFIQSADYVESQEQQAEVEHLMGIWTNQSGIAAQENQLRGALHVTALEIGTLEEEIETIVQHELPELEIEIAKRAAAIQALIQKIYGLSAQIEQLQPPAQDPAKRYLFVAKAIGQPVMAESVDADKTDTAPVLVSPERHPRTLGEHVLGASFVHKPSGNLSRVVIKTALKPAHQ